MNTTNSKHDDRMQAQAATTVRLSAPDRTTAATPARPAVDDDDAQWVTQRMFDHYNQFIAD